MKFNLNVDRLVRFSCYLGLFALALMVWSVIDRTVWPVLLALSAGQGIGTLSLTLFLLAVGKDLDLKKRLGR